MAFYTPLKLGINGIPTTVFIDEGTQDVLSPTRIALKTHLQTLYDLPLFAAHYRIVFIWKDGTDYMTNIRSFDKVGERGSGPLCDVSVFRGHTPEQSIGVGSCNTLIVLGLEETRRRQASDFKAYLQGSIVLPEELMLGEDFY